MYTFRSIVRGVGDTVASGIRELRRPPRAQLPALDALRSFAILLVVGHHWSIKEYVNAGGVRSAFQDNPLFYYGWTGVDLFFVLSGFLIGKQLWRELDKTGTINFGRFILRRGLRIWPIYFAILAYYAAFSTLIHPRWSDWTFLSNYHYGGFARGWSLSTEEQFYIAVPLLLLALRKRIPLLGYAWVLLGLEVAVLMNRSRFIQELIGRGVDVSHPPFRLTDPFHMHLEGLLAGLVIALLSVAKPATVAPAESARGVSWRGLAVFAGCTVLGFTLRAYDGDLFPFLALGLIFGGATYWALCDRSWMSKPLRLGVWYPISRLSYSMYLNHWWVWPDSSGAIVRATQSVLSNPTAVFLVTLIIGTALSVLIAAVMFVVVEHPFLVLRDRVLMPKPATHQ